MKKTRTIKCQCTKLGHGHKLQDCREFALMEFKSDDYDIWLCGTCIGYYDKNLQQVEIKNGKNL